jgi:hypothetical protein
VQLDWSGDLGEMAARYAERRGADSHKVSFPRAPKPELRRRGSRRGEGMPVANLAAAGMLYQRRMPRPAARQLRRPSRPSGRRMRPG